MLNASDEDARTDNFKNEIDRIFQTDTYTKFFQSYKGGPAQYEQLLSFGTAYDLVMPGTVTDVGMGEYEGDVIHYRLTGEQLIPGAYTIAATSRVTNIWAFIVTILIIALAIGSFFVRKSKTKGVNN